MTTVSRKNSETCTPFPLVNIGYKFSWSFLATTAWHSFYRLGTHNIEPGEEEILDIFEQV